MVTDAATVSKAGKERTPAAKDVLLGLAQEQAELFHTPDGCAFADVPLLDVELAGLVNDCFNRATFAVRSSAFRSWLSLAYYRQTGKAPSEQAVREVVATLEAKALHDGTVRKVFVRVGGEPDGRVTYLDLGDERWQAVRIDANGWQVQYRPDVRFLRPGGMEPLPKPVKGGSLDELWGFLNVREEDRPLVLAWLLMALRPPGPFPVLCLSGEQGSAKSTAARLLRALLDPNMAPLRSPARDERDLFIAATNSWVVALDNLSGLPGWLSDALCKLATGGGLTTRRLYYDNEESIFNAKRPVILTGIEDVAGRGDLRDRAILLTLPSIEEGRRRTERDFLSAFAHAHGRLLGALLDAAVLTLRAEPTVRLDHLPRMADFATVGVAAEKALGWPRGCFLRAYERNMAEANAGTLDDAPIVLPLLKLLGRADARGWDGACTDLLGELAEVAGYGAGKLTPRGWPSSPKALSNLLFRLKPNLRKAGVVAEPPSGSHNKGRRWHIYKTNGEGSPASVLTVPTVPEAEGAGTKEGDVSSEIPF